MRSIPMLAVPTVIATVALALSVHVAFNAAPTAAPVDPRFDQLETRLVDVERRLDAMGTGAAPAAEMTVADGRREPADVDARLQRIESELAEKTAAAAVGSEDNLPATGKDPAAERAPGMTKSGRPKRSNPQHLAWARQRALDPRVSPEERSDALGEIQKHGAEGYTDEVVHSMVALAQTAQDPKVRENIWRQFDGARNPVVSTALKQALAADAVADVRREAAEALDHYRDDPAVRAALEHAAQHDPDEKVRWEALRALRKPMKSQAQPPGQPQASPAK
jgi:hypothetical protein